jgi:choline dehydrogenase-like flavoprotein
MRILDLNRLSPDSLVDTDLCIVGSGPAGVSIATEFAGSKTNVLVLESGGLAEEVDTQSLYEIDSVGAPRTLKQESLRRRILGGSSHIWTGRCAPFNEVDFEERPWIPYSGWPLTRRSLEPYIERAGITLGLGPNCYDETLWQRFKVIRPSPELDRQYLEPTFWQFSRNSFNPKEPARFGQNLVRLSAANLRLLLHANVTHINTNADGTCFESVEVRSLQGKHARVRAKALALCCGGIENARLLLISNRTNPRGIGNRYDLVGRFLMDHITCVMGKFDSTDAAEVRDRFGQYWLDNGNGRSVYLHGLALSRETQRKEQLLNGHAYIEEYDIVDDDPWSALRNLRSTLGWRIATKQTCRDARVLLTHLGEFCRGLYRRQVKHRPQLTRVKRVELQCILEQMPDPESRVVLSRNKRDALGMPLSEINWKMNERERLTAWRMNQLICLEFQRLKLPIPRRTPWLDEETDWMSHFVERAHPSGSTRMSLDEKQGVVDPNCQIHGVEGLFVAGSSVFPTSGAANPTLMIVTMALRLADWLKSKYFTS